ncbi:MAG: hypothetical protein HQ568_10210 [Calditrichaeota bacterium]|nr:hypothetical protein [Calditrichota bacterium]
MPTEEVVIVGKTKAGKMVCIGALSLKSAANMRLKNKRFPFWKSNTKFEIGQCYKLTYRASTDDNNPHHSEDVTVVKNKLIRNMTQDDIIEFIHDKGSIVESEDPRYVFQYNGPNSPMRFDGASIYTPESDIEKLLNSVGFWICPFDLRESSGSYTGKNLRIKYVGVAPAIPVIKSDTIIRLSTAGLWQREGCDEYRSYLQISGWF